MECSTSGHRHHSLKVETHLLGKQMIYCDAKCSLCRSFFSSYHTGLTGPMHLPQHTNLPETVHLPPIIYYHYIAPIKTYTIWHYILLSFFRITIFSIY